MAVQEVARTRTGENQAMNLVRVIAALLVVFGHVRLLFFQNYADAPHSNVSAAIYAVTSIGPQAVIVFFVLSGYWVGGGALRSIQSGKFTWLAYATSRLTRLWLVLLPALSLTLAADALGHALLRSSGPYMRPGVYTGIPAHPVSNVGSFLGNLFFLQYIVPTKFHVQVFGTDQPLWSLAYEFWFYAAFPALVLAFRKGSLRERIMAAVVAGAALTVGGAPIAQLFPAWLLGAGVAAVQHNIRSRFRLMGRSLLWLQVGLATATLGVALAARSMTGLMGDYAVAATAAVFIGSLTFPRPWTSTFGRLLASIFPETLGPPLAR